MSKAGKMAPGTAPARSPVLVVGGAGFIGSHTAEALLAEGHQVRVLDDLSTGKRDNLPQREGLELVVGDVRDAAMVRRAMRGMRGCIHLAAQVSAVRAVEDPLGSATRNIMGFINVIEAMREEGVPRLVYASSAAVYGENQNLPLQEEEALQPTNPYGLEKQVDELYAGLYARLHGLNSLGLRYFNVYGPRQDPSSPYSGVISKFMQNLSSGEALTIFGDGHQTRDFVFVGDVARANVLALGSDYTGVCNVATGNRVELLALAQILGGCVGEEAQLQFAPPRKGDIRHSCGSDRRLRRQLGFAPGHSLEDGLGELTAFVKQEAAPAARPAPAPRARPAAGTRPLPGTAAAAANARQVR
jgi:UDP-glucose 4-epimerase